MSPQAVLERATSRWNGAPPPDFPRQPSSWYEARAYRAHQVLASGGGRGMSMAELLARC